MSAALLEIACFSPESVQVAAASGADRIELCADYEAGGITPPLEWISAMKHHLEIPLHIMIRPRAGDFIYSDAEFQNMKEQVLFCKQLACEGIVFGILTPDKRVDNERCKTLTALAKPMTCTFHRAFDELQIPQEGLEDIIRCGFSRILTSGGHSTALEGADNIRRYMEAANARIIIMPGGGIRSSNIAMLHHTVRACEYHSSAWNGGLHVTDAEEVRKLKQELI